MEYITFDVYKRYTYAVVVDEEGRVKREGKILHEPGTLAAFLAGCEPGNPVKTVGIGIGSWTRLKKRAVYPGSSTRPRPNSCWAVNKNGQARCPRVG